jgi:hypothetical protein
LAAFSAQFFNPTEIVEDGALLPKTSQQAIGLCMVMPSVGHRRFKRPEDREDYAAMSAFGPKRNG